VIVVNESHRAADIAVDWEGLPAPVRLQRYSLTKEAEDKTNVEIRPERELEAGRAMSDRIPPMSIVVYSTYRLNPEDPGLIASRPKQAFVGQLYRCQEARQSPAGSMRVAQDSSGSRGLLAHWMASDNTK
jgi:hypothetical protein